MRLSIFKSFKSFKEKTSLREKPMQIEVTKIELELIRDALYEFSVRESKTADDFKKNYNLDEEAFDNITIKVRQDLERQSKK